MVGPDAVLGAVLARVLAATPPTVQLPGIVGSTASLNAIVALIGRSGAGKSSPMQAARDYLPLELEVDIDLDGAPLGSGEGIAEAYTGMVEDLEDTSKKVVKIKKQTKTRALFAVDEGQIISEIGGRNGSTLLPALRSAWSGSELGQYNASAETRRLLAANAYRFTCVMALQPGKAQNILNDAEGGTPQRLWWLSSHDLTLPDVLPAEPPALQWQRREVRMSKRPAREYAEGYTPKATEILLTSERVSNAEAIMNYQEENIIEVMTVCETLRAEVIAQRRAVLDATAELDPLDAHRMLSREKVAAALALLADPKATHIDDDDWRLAGVFMDTSDSVRSWVVAIAQVERAAAIAAARHNAAGQALAVRRATDVELLNRLAKNIQRAAVKAGKALTDAECLRALASRDRERVVLADLLEHAVVKGLLVPQGEGHCAA